MRTIDADRLIARVMRLSQGRLLAGWTAAGLIHVIEEEAAVVEKYETIVTESRGKMITSQSRQ